MKHHRATLMVLGAGTGQVPAILRARAKGYRVIATSNNPADPGLQHADIPLTIDTTDRLRILQAAREYQIDGILTLATDVAMPSLGQVVDALGLRGPSYRSAMLASNKLEMKQRLVECGVPTAAFRAAGTLELAKQAVHAVGLPAVFKPADSSGSRGVTRIDDFSRVEEAFVAAKKVARDGIVLVEEFLQGVEFGAQAMVAQGQLQFVFPHNDIVTPPPFTTPIGHSYPLAMPEQVRLQTIEITRNAVRALEIDHSMINMDLMNTRHGVKVIEMAARLGGTCLPELTSLYAGMDVIDLAIDLAMGKPVSLARPFRQQPCAAKLIRAPQTGILKQAQFPTELLQDPRVVGIRWDRKPGDWVQAFKTGPDRIGEIVVIGETHREAEKLCDEIERQLDIHVEAS